MQEIKLPLEVTDIQQCIPHRYPFLLIDRVIELVLGERIVCIKNVSVSDPFLQGHFPGNPIYPGVLLIEGAAQGAGVLGHKTSTNGLSSCLLTEVTKSRFRRQVIPGDTIRYEIVLARKRAQFYWFDANITVDGQVAAQASISANMG